MIERKLKVFLCHAKEDKSLVHELYQQLSIERWIDPWFDEEKLLPGIDWDNEIKLAVQNSDVVVVCLSNNSINKKGYVQKELRFALDVALEQPEGVLFIIPVRLETCNVPSRLQTWQWVDYFPPELREKNFQQLIKSLKKRADNLKKSENHLFRMTRESKKSIGKVGNMLIGEITYRLERGDQIAFLKPSEDGSVELTTLNIEKKDADKD